MGPGFKDLSFQRKALEQYLDNMVLFKYNRSIVFKLLEKLIESKTKEKGISLSFLNNTSLSKHV